MDMICEFIGVIGFVIYISAFASLQLGWLDGNGNTYCLLVIAAAACVLIGLSSSFNLAAALIQISWIVIGAFGLLRRATLVQQR